MTINRQKDLGIKRAGESSGKFASAAHDEAPALDAGRTTTLYWDGLGAAAARVASALPDNSRWKNQPDVIAAILGVAADHEYLQPPASDEFETTREYLARIAERPEFADTEAAAVKIFADVDAAGQDIIIAGGADWPAGFADLGDGAPRALFTRGNTGLLADQDKLMSITGARASTGYGDFVATELATQATERGKTILTGGAYGIDASSIRSALGSGGAVVTFLPGGADKIFPAGNNGLLERAVEHGLIVTEQPPGTNPTRIRSFRRSELIAAAAGAVVVVEAGARSGSKQLAARGHELGRPIFAVPGPVTSVTSTGCHDLIRSGIARIATNVDDIYGGQ